MFNRIEWQVDFLLFVLRHEWLGKDSRCLYSHSTIKSRSEHIYLDQIENREERARIRNVALITFLYYTSFVNIDQSVLE